jgi:membrane protease YdiL (CAAX protease family)
MLAKRFGITVAILCAPVCFSLSHMVQFGIGPHLIVLFFAGVTYTIMRFYSGNLLMPIIGHMAIQFLISVPKWVVAVMYFKQV